MLLYTYTQLQFMNEWKPFIVIAQCSLQRIWVTMVQDINKKRE